jgi:fermentation-respiration switch protein FrsA (DUF1100 family)
VKRSVLSFLLVLLTAYVAVCVLMLLVQARLVYFPGPPPEVTPSARGLPYRDLELATSDGERLHGWFLAAPNARGAVLMSHGNAGNVAGRIPHAEALLAAGLSVLLFDYRGYGNSTGSPSEEGTYRDAEAAYDWLVGPGGVEPERVALYGESLGAGVALELALRRDVACVVVESAFTSVPALGQRLYPWLPVKLLARIRYDNAAKIGGLAVPVLVIHSPADEIVPFELGRALFERAREPKAFLETEGGHNDGGFLRRAEWRRAVGEFVRAALDA